VGLPRESEAKEQNVEVTIKRRYLRRKNDKYIFHCRKDMYFWASNYTKTVGNTGTKVHAVEVPTPYENRVRWGTLNGPRKARESYRALVCGHVLSALGDMP
jgi:hypothetical protein